jgi:hypothetical protein
MLSIQNIEPYCQASGTQPWHLQPLLRLSLQQQLLAQ